MMDIGAGTGSEIMSRIFLLGHGEGYGMGGLGVVVLLAEQYEPPMLVTPQNQGAFWLAGRVRTMFAGRRWRTSARRHEASGSSCVDGCWCDESP